MEEDDPAVLRMALFLHDIGKGTAPGDHVRGSLESAAQILSRLKVPGAIEQSIAFLIEKHLVLSQLMNGRDLDDPATARLLTSQVGIQEDLRRLTLLTYADISAVNPTAMTPWRLEQLWRTYTLGTEQLTRELSTSRIQPSGVTGRPELAHFLEGLPTRYLRTHTEAEVERHFQLEEKRKAAGVAVQIEAAAGAYSMAVVADDRPGLFASLCGALASFGMNILKAEAFSNASHTVLDLFRFNDPMRTLELNPGEVNRLQWTVECVVRGSLQVSDLLKRRRAAPRPNSNRARIVPNVRFNSEASDTSTLIEFIGEDRPGLLYDLASTLSGNGCDIEVVLIDTEGHKAIDVFYVTREGGKLDEGAQERLAGALIGG
jgi:[protein-PII] uridylyltransferase